MPNGTQPQFLNFSSSCSRNLSDLERSCERVCVPCYKGANPGGPTAGMKTLPGEESRLCPRVGLGLWYRAGESPEIRGPVCAELLLEAALGALP